MKNRIYALKLFLMLYITAVLAGCMGSVTPVMYKSSAPPEKLATLLIAPSLTVKKFDGENVTWKPDFLSWLQVQVPEGRHVFIMDAAIVEGVGAVYSGSDLDFSYDNFVAGRTYRIWARAVAVTGKGGYVAKFMIREE
jgi:hypothetical protein